MEPMWTPKERKKLYERMLKDLYFAPPCFRGLCTVLAGLSRGNIGIEQLPELMTQKPAEAGPVWWWHWKEVEPRAKALRAAIELCDKQPDA